eukprot:GGOE01056237.1.p3 GENE.GGOE01056237.1~~GGOE01056237.1.p3  ORF type:complete len:114 (-),score=0.31 GGOE01056237.1:361-702(-)
MRQHHPVCASCTMQSHHIISHHAISCTYPSEPLLADVPRSSPPFAVQAPMATLPHHRWQGGIHGRSMPRALHRGFPHQQAPALSSQKAGKERRWSALLCPSLHQSTNCHLTSL